MKKALAALLGFGMLACATPASAHFMMTYTPETVLEKAKDIEMRIVFTHPAEAGHTMDMGGVKEFYAIHKRGDSEAKKIDFKGSLKEITWKNPESSNKAYAAQIAKKDIKSMGDYMFVMVPGYYLEKEEDTYMQQITKLLVNVGGIPGNWSEPAGLPCEIVPMAKPYGLWTGNVFQAQVLSEGKPVANAEIEVEYMSHKPDLKKNGLAKKCDVQYPNDVLVTQTIVTDANGVFSFGLPRAGWWGFAALGVGPEKKHEGKEMSQDAVIWVQAVDMK
jgi:cobalt/nickel transport protein